MKVRRWRKNKVKTILFSITLFVSLLIIYQTFTSLYMNDVIEPTKTTVATTTELDELPVTEKVHSFKGEKLVHVDLKGAPPLVSYFKRFFPYIRDQGATGVLIEYADMFPYKDGLENISAKNSYGPGDLKTIIKLAEESNLMVVPSIQVLGHLEFVLKLKEFKDLREVSEYPETICPTNEKAFALVRKMIDQVLKAHPKAKYIHIGCGEVHYVGTCPQCRGLMSKMKWAPPDLYVSYIKKVAVHINETYPGVRPIVWGDIISKLSQLLLLKSEIHTVVDLMVFVYGPNVTDHLTDKTLYLYANVFKSIWIASAFKGVTAPNQRISEATFHLENQISWMGVVKKWKTSINFKGILLTGRQRYNHFAELCELLPVAVPSLTISLIYLNHIDSFKQNLSEKILQCEHTVLPSYHYYSSTPECNFPGLGIFRIVRKYENLYQNMKKCFSLTEDGLFSIYNVVHKFISPVTVNNILEKVRLEEHLSDLITVEDELKTNLLEVYDHDTVEEWVETHVRPAKIKLEALMLIKEILTEVDTWPRRPFDDLLLAKEAKKICTSDRKIDCILLFI